jgi:hypothetical protein
VDSLRAEAIPDAPGQAWARRARAAGRHERYVVQCAPGASAETRWDQPTADSFRTRRFGVRYVQTSFHPIEEAPDA